MALTGLRNLCTPSYVYLVISMILLGVMYFQNRNNVAVYCLGEYECDVTNVTAIFLVKFIYILFWTWILNLICKSGSPSISWLLLLLPFILFFLMIALMFIK
jgi:hypothetical protein